MKKDTPHDFKLNTRKDEERMMTPYQRVNARIKRYKYKGEGISNFYTDLVKFYDLEDNIKTQRAYSIAWEREHSNGLFDVLSLFDDLAYLIK